jgi:segregation and condensation protein A
VREQTVIVIRLLRAAGRASFAELAVGCEDTYEIVARFLAVLDLYRDKCVSFEQQTPLGDLNITWIAGDSDDCQPAGSETTGSAVPGRAGGSDDRRT